MASWSRLPRSARGFHGMTPRAIAAVLATGFTLGAVPVAAVGGGVVYLWLRYLEVMNSQDAL